MFIYILMHILIKLFVSSPALFESENKFVSLIELDICAIFSKLSQVEFHNPDPDKLMEPSIPSLLNEP